MNPADLMGGGVRPRLLDLFCCAGGAAMGYYRAGFDVVGVDIKPQPRYPFEFIQADIVDVASWTHWIREFDAIHASPPCQAHTSMKTMPDAREHVDLIPITRALLKSTGLPYVIENVVGARSHLIAPTLFCGSMFGLGASGAQLQRHRLFETNFLLMSPGRCSHNSPVIGIYGEGCRDSRRKYDKTIPELGLIPFGHVGINVVSAPALQRGMDIASRSSQFPFKLACPAHRRDRSGSQYRRVSLARAHQAMAGRQRDA